MVIQRIDHPRSIEKSLRWEGQPTNPKVGGGESIAGGGGNGGVRVSVVGVDVGQQGAYDGWHTGTSVHRRQAREMPET